MTHNQTATERAHRSISLDIGLMGRCEKYIGTEAGFAYKSVAAFVEDAVRRRIEELEREDRMSIKQ